MVDDLVATIVGRMPYGARRVGETAANAEKMD
jgi:hypothetical protein